MSKYYKISKKYKLVRARAAVIEEGDLYVIGRYNSDGVYRYELAGGKIDKKHKKPLKAAKNEPTEEFGRKTLVDCFLVSIKSPHSGIENRIFGAMWAKSKGKIKLQREEGFTTYRKINSSNYHKYKYNYSTEKAIYWLLKNGYLR